MRRETPAIRLCQVVTTQILAALALAAGADLRADGLQTFVTRLLQGRAGAVIVSDPNTGRILALWNPQSAFREAYPPGSTAKLVVSAAALEEKAILPSDTIFCRRVPRLLGESFHCVHAPTVSPFDLAGALAYSCNYFFSELSTRLSAPALAHWFSVFGFGTSGEEGSPGEVSIPDKPKGKALAALGELGVTATPAQVLLAYSAIATHGSVFSLIMPGQNKAPSLDRVVALHDSTFTVLRQGLRDCVVNGSCRAAAVAGVTVAGRTGTAPALDGSRATHAWFVGYAPAESPQIAVVVFLKRGTGGANAAPLAARILQRYFQRQPHTP